MDNYDYRMKAVLKMFFVMGISWIADVLTWCQCYKTFSFHNLQMFVIR
jgi:hypothetical protein